MGAIGEIDETRRRSDSSSATRRRHMFFCLASLWGYVLGIGVLAAALSRGETEVAIDRAVALWLTGGSLAVMAGGWIAAGAYRESRRRHR